MGLYLHSHRSKIQSGLALVEALRESGSHSPDIRNDRKQKVWVLVIRTGELQGLLRLECHRLGGDRDNMVRRTREVRRDLKPPRNRRSNGISLVSIDEEMCPLRLQRQQGHVGHRQTHASATSSFSKILLHWYRESGM